MTSVTVTIGKLAGLGDGMGLTSDGRKIFVPYTLPGDNVLAHITRRTKDADYATLTEVLSPSPDRVPAPCPHFTQCGGCSLQHLPATLYQQFKQRMAEEAVRKAGFDPALVSPLHVCPPHTRRRTEFALQGGELGFFQERSHDIVPIDDCMLLEPALQALVRDCRADWLNYPAATSVQINGVDDGYDVVLTVTRFTDASIAKHPQIRRMSVTMNGVTQLLWQQGEARLSIGDIRTHIPAGAFLQATREAQELLCTHATGWVSDSATVHDLFCGIGTYGLALAKDHTVMFWENDSPMVDTLGETLRENNLTRSQARKRDLFANPLPIAHFGAQDGIIINPPRIGAKAQCMELAECRATKLAMISCNPATFTRDAAILKSGGWKLYRLYPVDQFTYSAHLELAGLFSR